MKYKKSLFVLIVVSSVSTPSLHAQGTFQNLGFEQAAIVPVGGGNPSFYVVAASALPNWNTYINNSTVDWIVHNTISLSGTAISIHDAASSRTPLRGNYSVFLQGSSATLSPNNVSVAQTGLIPVGSQSLLFRAWGDNFQVSVNGQTLSLIPVSSGGNYTVYGTDITPFAGSSTELRFTALPTGSLFFDSIQFSTSPVPEPTIIVLTGIGACLFGFRRWLRRK